MLINYFKRMSCNNYYTDNKIILFFVNVILIVLFLLISYSHGYAVEISADITTDTLWTSQMGPYVITKNLIIAEEATLKIEPGVIVKFSKGTDSSQGYSIKVNGTLDAQGADNNPILFTNEDPNKREGNYWGTIEFTEKSNIWDDANATGCTLSSCIIEYAGKVVGDTYGKAALRLISAAPRINNIIIRYSMADGILSSSGVPHITGNRIHDTQCGIKLIAPEGGLLENNFLINNQQGITLESSSGTLIIRNNTVHSASSEIYGGGLGITLLYHDNLASSIWEQLAGPHVDLSDDNTLNPAFTAPDVSSDTPMTFQLTVTDKGGLISVDTVSITVTRENRSPLADAGHDQNVTEGRKVTLDASNSFDPDGDTLSYQWEQTSGQQIQLSNASSEHCTFTTPTGIGIYGETFILQLTVSDSGGLRSMDTVNIYVKREENQNKLPIAYAGSEKTVLEGASVILDGSGSTDPENAFISWMWRQTEGPPVEIINPASAQANFESPEVESAGKCLVFQLTVTDSDFQQSSDKVIVNVIDTDSNTPNTPPIADAGDDRVVNEEKYTPVTLNGSATDPNTTIDTITYSWEQISGISVSLSGTGTSRTFTIPDVKKDEELIFRFTVTDFEGLKSSDRVKITVKWINEKPTTDAGADQTVEEGIKVKLDGSKSSDADDGIASYLWEQTSGPDVMLSSDAVAKPIFITPQVLSNNQLIFRLSVTDRSGDSSYDFIIVNVMPKNKLPVADAGEDKAVYGGTMVTLDGSGSYAPEDPNTGIVSYLWEERGKTTVTLYNATSVNPYFIAPQISAGEEFTSLSFLLTVKDKDDQTSTDSVVVNIVREVNTNQMPNAEAGHDKTVSTGATVNLDGSRSGDPDILSEIQIKYNAIIHDNSDGTGNAIAIREMLHANATIVIHSNNFEQKNGNFMVYLYDWADRDSPAMDMSGNWWGTNSLGEITSMIYDYNLDHYLPQVQYSPQMDTEIAGGGSNLSYPPIAEAGKDQTKIKPDTIVILDGSKTYDPEGIMFYKWTQIEGQEVTLNNADKASATFASPTPKSKDDPAQNADKEVLKFKITVTDSKGFYDIDEISITIEAAETNTSDKIGSGCFISVLSRIHK